MAPQAAKLGICGTVAIQEGYAFFHRIPDRRVDEPDIEAKAPVLIIDGNKNRRRSPADGLQLAERLVRAEA